MAIVTLSRFFSNWAARMRHPLSKVPFLEPRSSMYHRPEVRADRSRVGHGPVDHGQRIRVRVAAVAEQLVKQHADGEQVRGSVPLGDVGVGRLIGGVPDCVCTGAPTREAMLKSSSFTPVRVSITLRGLMSRWIRPRPSVSG